MKFDLHVHSEYSPCSSASLSRLIESAPALGLDGLCITDHDTMSAGLTIEEGIQYNGIVVLIGMEYTTESGDFLIFGPFQKIKPGLSAPVLLNTVREAEGIAIGAHPKRGDRPIDEAIFQKGLCNYIEIINGRNSNDENLAAEILLDEYKLRGVGGSDAHSLSELGQSVTVFKNKITSTNDLIDALRTNNFHTLKRSQKNLIPL